MKHPGGDEVDVSRETLTRLQTLGECLLLWNRRINLIARSDEADVWRRHFEDSAQLAPLISPSTRIAVDMGSGAGFPGLVLAIISGIHFHLIESDQRKAAFLREASRLTNAPTKIHATRVQDVKLPPVRLVTARALAPLSSLLSLAAPLLAADGECLFLKGRNADAELTDASRTWQVQVRKTASVTDPNSCILRIGNINRVGPTP